VNINPHDRAKLLVELQAAATALEQCDENMAAGILGDLIEMLIRTSAPGCSR
jgi:hypothetical protein